jgi:hypothetical protein
LGAVQYKIFIGTTPVIILYQKGSGKTFVHLHQNEKTALKAAQAVLKKEGGSLITLVHPGKRNIVFRYKRRRYEFDPNRIFSDSGIKKTLKQFGPYNLEAHAQVNKLASKLKQLLPKDKVIAVHNNASFSFKDYLPGHGLASNAKALYRNPKMNYRNFYLVTQHNDFERLKAKGLNGILQKPSVEDDGSLSVLLSKNNYINVEAGYGQLNEQVKMLQLA